MTTAAAHRDNSRPDADGLRTPASRSVCFISECRAFGGVEIHTIGLIDTMLEAGYSIELVCCRHQLLDEAAASPSWRKGVRVVHTDLSTGYDIDFRFHSGEWQRFLQKIASDTLIFPKGGNSQGNIGFLRACHAHFSRVFFIEHLEEIMPPRATRKFGGFIPVGLGLWWYRRRWFKAIQSRFADHTIAVSDAVKRGLVSLGAPAERTTTVHNGVAWRKFARDPGRAQVFRAQHGIHPHTFVFGMLARLRPQKGIDIALRAVQQLKTRTTRTFCLVIAGEGSDLDSLLSLATNLGIEETVKFIGFVARPVEILSAYDSILFSSRLEGLPLGLLEGMAAGCIPIVTRVSGMPEAVSDSGLGWVVPPESPEELAHAMQCALELDSTALTTMRRSVVEAVQARFDVDKAHHKLLQTLGL